MKAIQRSISPATLQNINAQMTMAQRKAHGRGYDLGFGRGFKIGGAIGIAAGGVLMSIVAIALRFAL